MAHSFWSPSKSHMWMHCHGAMAQPENQVPGGTSDFADDGTASHTLAAWSLENNKDPGDYPDLTITVGQKEWDVDSERVDFVQIYVDEVRRRSMGGILFIEHRVDLGDYLGEGPCWKCLDHSTEPDPACEVCQGSGIAPQGGTSDAVILLVEEETLIAADLKYGMGEKVWAGYFPEPGAKKRKINTQCGNYLLGAKKKAEELGHKVKKFVAVISQPRLDHHDEFEITAEELETFADEVRQSIARGQEAMTLGVEDPKLDAYLAPDEKTCRWCNAKVRCKALARFTAASVKLEFDEETGQPIDTEVPSTAAQLAQAYLALPLIQQWVKAVNKALWDSVPTGTIMGPDGQPLKIVQGKGGKRMWDPTQKDTAVGLMVGAVGAEAYKPQETITAPEFEKVLKKRLGLKGKKFEAHWDQHWKPYITNAKGSLSIAWGSDPRPAAGKADASEFDDEISTEGES
jgi:hypothetical protein